MPPVGRPSKKAKTDFVIPALPTIGDSTAEPPTNDLTALTTAQLYSLSSRRHRDESRECVRRALEERDRAYLALEQSQRWLERANENLERMEENAREAHKEYLDAKMLLSRMRQSHVAAGGGDVVLNLGNGHSSDDDEGNDKVFNPRLRKSDEGKGKAARIDELIIQFAKSGDLCDGRKLFTVESDLVPNKDHAQFVNAMKLVEELWTEEEELFLRSSPEEIQESLEELKIIAETISTRCLTKLNEWEGRPDPRPSGHQKPVFTSVGNRAKRIFSLRGKNNNDE
mmetsp:Transcript_23013/g.47305  ORF Transcript_23013/g.47305 Transcript_23013/m.47305 type:complete len:284 (+) Transcript_23013:272-1123(+)